MNTQLPVPLLLLFLLITLQAQQIDSAQRSPITYVLNTANASLFQTYFPSLNAPITWTPLVSDSLTNTREVSRTITSWNTPAGPLVSQLPSVLSENKVQTPTQGICTVKVTQFRQSLLQFSSNDFNNDNLSPGTILNMAKPNDVFSNFQAVYIPPLKRNSYNIRYGNGISLTPATGITDPTTALTLTRGKLYASQTILNSNIIVDFKNASETNQIMKSLGLSSKVYQDLGLAISSPAQSSPTCPGKVTIVLFQSLFSSAVDFSAAWGPVNPASFFLNNNFTPDDLYSYVRFGYWGAQNGPTFISQANYGRLVVMTVNQNSNSLALLDRLKLITADPTINSSALESVISEFFSDKSLLTYSRGLNAVLRQSIKTIMDLNNFFMPITPSSLLEGGDFQPLSVSMINFSGTRLSQLETRTNCYSACQVINKVVILINQVDREVSFRLKRRGEALFNTFLFTLDRPGSYDVTNMLSMDNEFRVTLRGKRKFSMKYFATRFYSSLSFSLVINGKVHTTKELACKRCQTEYRNFDCRVNLADGTVYC